MKIKKLLIAFLAALSLIVLAAGLSACDFISGLFGDNPQNPPSTEQPSDPDPEPPQPEICVHVYGEWTDEINNCNVHRVKRVCSLCGDIEYDLLEAGHIYGPWTDIVNNCTVHTQKRFCTKCGDIQTNSLPAKGHSYGEWEVVTDTCTEYVQKRVCSECKEEEEKTLTPIGHSYGEWIDEVKTCTKHIQKQTCSGCGDFKKRALKTDGHDFENGTCKKCGQSVADGGGAELDKYNGDYGYNYFKQNNLSAQQTLYERIDAGVRAFHLDKTANAEQKLQNGKTCT